MPAHAGPKEDQLKATREAAQHSDLLLLVLHARNPARQADLSMLQRLSVWFAARPDLKMPRVLAVLTHIDLLSPAMDWSPPYNWEQPQRPKEISIDAATAAAREQLGPYLVGVVPLCVAPGTVGRLHKPEAPAKVDRPLRWRLRLVSHAEVNAILARHRLLLAEGGLHLGVGQDDPPGREVSCPAYFWVIPERTPPKSR